MNLRSEPNARAKAIDARGRMAAGITLLVLSAILLVFMLFPAKTPEAAITEVPAPLPPDAYGSVTLTAKAAIVYDLATGITLYEKNEYAQLPLASITKLISVYAASKTLDSGTLVPITASALSMEGDSGLKEGQEYAFSDLARFALVASSNDAAEAIAEAASKAHAETNGQLLASAVEALGLHQTYAINGTGLDENENVAGAYGSARDIALLAAGLVKQAPTIARATVSSAIEISSNGGTKVSAKNTNPDVGNMPGLMLSKTGFTDLAGGNLVVVFDAGIGHPVAIVALGSTKNARFTDTNALLAATLAHFAGTTP